MSAASLSLVLAPLPCHPGVSCPADDSCELGECTEPAWTLSQIKVHAPLLQHGTSVSLSVTLICVTKRLTAFNEVPSTPCCVYASRSEALEIDNSVVNEPLRLQDDRALETLLS